MAIRIFVTGGTFDKEYNELNGTLFFKDTHINEMLKLGRAQGVAMAAGLSRGIPITEYEPKKIKMAITGNGNASKEQVAKMLQQLLGLKELPKNRQPIITKIILPNQREKIYQFVKTEIKNGRQVFVICPLINDSPKLELKSVNQEYEKLKGVFPDFKIGVLHGKLKSKEKEKIMHRYKA